MKNATEDRDAWTRYVMAKSSKRSTAALRSTGADASVQNVQPEGVMNHAPTSGGRGAIHCALGDSNVLNIALCAMLEAEWHRQVEQIAGLCRWTKYHTRDSRGSDEGFPDLILLRPPRWVVAELKKMGEDPTAEQLEWLRLFAACGAETFVWRPSDFDQVSTVLR